MSQHQDSGHRPIYLRGGFRYYGTDHNEQLYSAEESLDCAADLQTINQPKLPKARCGKKKCSKRNMSCNDWLLRYPLKIDCRGKGPVLLEVVSLYPSRVSKFSQPKRKASPSYRARVLPAHPTAPRNHTS